MKDRARSLRKNHTKPEQLLWYFFRNRNFSGHKFRRQYVIKDYIVDFVCLEQKLIIEVDGSQHVKRKEYDDKRTQILMSLGFRVLRFWNNEVLNELNKVLSAIHLALSPSPGAAHHPLPQAREGNHTFQRCLAAYSPISYTETNLLNNMSEQSAHKELVVELFEKEYNIFNEGDYITAL